MIIFGHYHRKISKQPVTVQLRDQQGSAQPMSVDVFQQFIHLFWIPIAPVGKKVGFKQDDEIFSIKTEALAPADQQAVNQLLASSGTPWWGFSGLILLLGLLVYGYFFVGDDTEQAAPPAAEATATPSASTGQPQVGQVWVLTYGSKAERKNDFTFAKVTEVRADSVVVQMCTRSFTLQGFRQLAAAEFAKVVAKQDLAYGPRSVAMSFKQIEMRKTEGMLLHVLPPLE